MDLFLSWLEKIAALTQTLPPWAKVLSALIIVGAAVLRWFTNWRRRRRDPVAGKYFAAFGHSSGPEVTKSVLAVNQTGYAIDGKNAMLDKSRTWTLKGRLKGGVVQGTYDEKVDGRRLSSGGFVLARGPGLPSQLAPDLGENLGTSLRREDFFGGWIGQDADGHGKVNHGYYLWRRNAPVNVKSASKFPWCRNRLHDASDVLRDGLGTYIQYSELLKRVESNERIWVEVAYLKRKPVGAIVFSIGAGDDIGAGIKSKKAKKALEGRPNVGFLEHLAVTKAYRGTGIASTLLTRAIETFDKSNCGARVAVSWLPQRPGAQTSLGLLKAFKFEEIERIPKYWADAPSREDYCPECAGQCQCDAAIALCRD
ncbi:Acetyltransferase (GNAT) family protein [Variovorax sp. PBL-H6]|uniref:GNAT family N-acetyltransferase n=1 Tax=Variovorax sp. PBL-H6 TaxID=434009 RepID=UPI001315F480|nr:GNAT family N-acetyltransferase [Variovorax sp. PBL-H6]VTU29448.1 Acetyltransferase (GNAT) family protein [Variovorax sp. PBL-H6]